MFSQNISLHQCNVWQLAELLYLLQQKREPNAPARLTFTEIDHLDISEYLDLLNRSVWTALKEIPVAEIILQWITENGANDNTIADAVYNQVGEKNVWTLKVDPNITFYISQEGENIKCLTLYGDEYTWYNSGEHESLGLIDKKEKE